MAPMKRPLPVRVWNSVPVSLPLKLKLADVLLLKAGGLLVMLVSGARLSIVQVKLAGVESVLPALSVARTSKVWLPSAREV